MSKVIACHVVVGLSLLATAFCAQLDNPAVNENSGHVPDNEGANGNANDSARDDILESRRALQSVWISKKCEPDHASTSQPQETWEIGPEFVVVTTKLKTQPPQVTKFRYHIAPSSDPPELTLFNEQSLRQGIYKLNGDHLIVVFPNSEADARPRDFVQSSPGAHAVNNVLDLQRQLPRKQRQAEHHWEDRAVEALISEQSAALKSLSLEFQQLPVETRRKLYVNVREDLVEFTFQGTVEGDQNHLDFIEFLIAGRDKNYEALLVAPESELQRVEKLRAYFDHYPQTDRATHWRARLMWVEGNELRSAELSTILGNLDPRERAGFLDALEIDNTGYLGAELTSGKNVAADRAAVPQQTVAASLVVTLQRVVPQ